MFKIFKRPGRQSNERSSSERNDTKRHSLSLSTTSSSINEESPYIDEIYDINEEQPIFEYVSRLSMNLNAIINEKSCLIYFVQFLESKKALPLIKFYLDTENFKTASENDTSCKNPDESCCFCSFSDDANNKASSKTEKSTVVDSKAGENNSEAHNKDNNTDVPGSEARYDLSMQKSLTDDEKSQIYAENNKRQLVRSESTTSKHTTCKTTDAISIYKKYFMPSSAQYVSLPVGILSEISLVLCSDERQSCQNQKISTNLFGSAQHYVLEKLEQDYLNEFLQSDLYCRYCIEFLSSSEMILNDILYSESALFYFMEYLEQENQRNCLDFWMAAINFRKHYEKEDICDSNRNEAQSDAMILYEKYFSLQATCPLKISPNIRSIVEECICSNESTSRISRCFDRPLKIIEHYLEREFFPNFIESQLYSKFVVELQSKLSDYNRMDIASNQVATPRITKHRKTMSDCTNKTSKDLRKHYISQHNTLLAMESHSSTQSKRSTSSSTNNSPDMQIDSRHFVDPDMLWQRHQSNGNVLKFGRINSLGRYERDFEICPTTSKNWSLSSMGSNTIKNVVRKLVNIPEDKIQEEIAWQIAEMIIDDVLSITMNRELSSRKSV
ncbi:A-kinase anchor protein 10, mitochondrial [Episyrphus balteatus]|uniref:A-kinase anchor protein 10, mitochondrial n=1 Tax=Episyrphus balteatus TaxID=286459 RepID=UPI0024865975|nr:A-kinase anchor protein 10, mitochondrial [Episyrphus balteatus]